MMVLFAHLFTTAILASFLNIIIFTLGRLQDCDSPVAYHEYYGLQKPAAIMAVQNFNLIQCELKLHD